MISILMFFPNSTNPGATISPSNWVFSTDYASLALAVATGKHVYIPPSTTESFVTADGTYPVDSFAKIKLAPYQIIVGADKYTSKIIVNGNGRGIQLGKGSQIHNLTIEAINGSTYQAGLVTNDIDFSITNCIFKNFQGGENGGGGGGCIQLIGNNSVDYKRGGIISYCDFENSVTGLNIMTRAEFLNVNNCNFFTVGTGIANRAGNNSFDKIKALYCTVAYSQQAGANDGHGTISNSYFNHNTKALKINDQSLGVKITGSMFYDADIEITNSDRIVFSNCDLDSGAVMTLTNNAVSGVKAYGGYYNAAGYTVRNVTGADIVVV